MPKRKLPPNEIITGMYRSGLSSGEIAERFDVSPITVDSMLRRIGEPRRSTSDAAKLAHAKGRATAPQYWTGKKQPPEMIEKRISAIRGENHYLWKGGASNRDYRGIVEKDACAGCGGRFDLGIHHVDFDHYNNAPEHHEVLCVSCHMSLHKQAYWDAVRAGEEPPKSNGPVGWTKKGGG